MYKEISACRNCNSINLVNILSLGNQYLTGVFPATKEETVTRGPVDLLWCHDCYLIQLKQSYDPVEMYGNNYGYRSGLNQSMVNHLQTKVHYLMKKVNLFPNDIILDIGSNDATTLKCYPDKLRRIGIDPSGNKFGAFYPADIKMVSDFFTVECFQRIFTDEKAKIVTSIAMFYDLEDPSKFSSDIEQILADDGIWHFEQSYLPAMLRNNSYDTICQEHLEYYSLTTVKNILEKNKLKIIDIELNDINGGSFAVTAAKKNSTYTPNNGVISWMLEEEIRIGLHTLEPYRQFSERILKHRSSLISLLDNLKMEGKKIIGYGASTKGNVLLQYCHISTQYLDYIAEVNKQKFGAYTPGTLIPVISESEALTMKPDYLFVLPWHFRNNILNNEKLAEYRASGGKFIFPLPYIEIV